MSPFCPGVTLHDCPSDAAIDLRARIERWARAGLSDDAIVARLSAQYGPAIAAAPSRSGPGWVAWLLPVAALVGGAAAAAAMLRRWSRARSDAGGRGGPLGPEDRARLDAELAELKESR